MADKDEKTQALWTYLNLLSTQQREETLKDLAGLAKDPRVSLEEFNQILRKHVSLGDHLN